MLYFRKELFFPSLPISWLTLAFLLIFNLPARSADCTDSEIEEQIEKFKLGQEIANPAIEGLKECSNYQKSCFIFECKN